MRDRIVVLALVIGAFGLPGCKGCSGGSTPAAAEAAAASSEASAEPNPEESARPARRVPPFRVTGPGGALFRALYSLEIRDDQVARLTPLAASLRGPLDAGPQETGEFKEALAEGAKAGKLDAAKLEPHYAAIERIEKAREAREDAALNALHALLDPPQRKAAAENARMTIERRDKRAGAFEDAGRPLPFERFLKRLDLDPMQRKKADALAPKFDHTAAHHDATQKYQDALFDAFEKDGFDAAKIDSGAAKRARTTAEDTVKFAAQLLPLLEPPQRERLAKQLPGLVHDPVRLGRPIDE